MPKILVIEDDESSRKILKLRLEAAGHNVLEAENGIFGLSMAKEFRPDLIFLDIMMPKMDGWQVCRALKADAQTSKIPVVILTALTEQVDALRGMEVGADEYITKPWDITRLLETVAQLVGKSKPYELG